MARPALAGIEDLEARLGKPIPDVLQALARLEDASEIVRAYAGRTWLNADEDAVEDVPGQIPGIVASMVERATRNPDGITSEAAGPFNRSFGSDAAARLYLTKAEKLVVRAAAGRTGLGAISTTRGPLETGSVSAGYGTFSEEEYTPLTNLMGGT